MAVRLPIGCMNEKLRKRLQEDLILTAKGLNSKSYKPACAQLDLIQEDAMGVTIPLVYARQLITLTGMRNPKRVKIELKTKTRSFRKGQKDVFDEAVASLKKTFTVFLQLHCGWGKTWIGLNLIAEMGMRTMILVHRSFLAHQFLNEAEGIIPGQVTWIQDNNVNAFTPGSVFICTDRRAVKLPEDFRKTIDMIVVDEAKYWCTPTRVEAMMAFTPTHTIGLCAERKRKDGFETVLERFFGHNIFRKSNKPFRVWKYMTEFVPEQQPVKFGHGINWTVAMSSLARMNLRNMMIRDICRLRPKNKIMILVQYKHHVETLEKMLKEVGEQVDTLYGKKNGYKNCRILIATFSKAEMGFDDKNLCDGFDGQRLDLLILGSFYKKEIEQSAGRVMRTDAPEIIDIVDDYSTLKKHSKTRDKWYRSRAGTIMPAESIYYCDAMHEKFDDL